MQFPIVFTAILLLSWQHISADIQYKGGAPQVKLTGGGHISGSVKLSRDGRPYNAFVGIPYAKVPERFAEPQFITKPTWEGVLNATKPGAMCPQMNLMDLSLGGVGSEDCLFINVYAPVGKTNLPVMVWIHGGGFIFGSGNEYDPQYFMDANVIFVSLNYRLGPFGFLSTGDNVIPGNNGMKDMVVALKWVQQNIKIFGGNPGKVTIFGESAGGAAVHHLMLSPTTKGLFHRAISQSGTALSPWAYAPNPRQIAVEMATYLKCPSAASEISSEEMLTCFKAATTDEFNLAQFKFRESWLQVMSPMYFVPTAEPKDHISDLTPFQSEPPISILTLRKDSKLQDIPWIVGATEDEMACTAGLILENPEKLKDLNENFDKIAPELVDYEKYVDNEERDQVSRKFREFYFGDKEISEETRVPLRNVFSDDLALHSTYRSALETAKRGIPVYLYSYAYQGPFNFMSAWFNVKGEEAQLVNHADDLQHHFPLESMIPGLSQIIKPDTPDEEFSKNFVRLWASFAIDGEPTWGNTDTKIWKPICKKQLNHESPMTWFKINGNPDHVEVSQDVKDRVQFWDNLWSEHLTPAVLRNLKDSTITGERNEL